MTTILKLGLFALSNLGYWEYFSEKHKINRYFAPVFTLAVQFAVLFAAGICNCLEVMTFALYGAGLFLGLKCLYQTKLRFLRGYCDWGYVYFAVVVAAVGVSVVGSRFAHIDNFTHWATVVRSMLYTDRFPCFKDTVVSFTTYPLGTAAYIYYFCRLTSDAEWFQMLAQGYMIVCTLFPIFAYARKNKLPSVVLITAMSLFLLQYNVRLTDLRVDTVMALAGVATMVFVWEHCVTQKGEKPLSLYYAFPMLLWTMNIKHAALLYVVLVMILLLPEGKESRKRKKEWLILGGALLLAKQIWSLHCDYVYFDESAGMHSMSADWFRYVLGDKSPEDILQITRNFASFVISGRSYFWLLTWLVVLVVLVLWLGGDQKKRFAALLGSAVGLYVVYTVGVLGMYIFSMPVWEELNGAERYMKTADVVTYYIFTICAVQLLSGTVCRKRSAAAAVAVIALALAGWKVQYRSEPELSLFCDEESRRMVEQPIEEYGVGYGQSYLLCVSEDMRQSLSDIPRYIWRYNLLTDDVDQIVVTEAAQLDVEKNYDYVVIFDQDNPVIRQWLQENYPDCTEQMIIQHFV